MKKVKMNLVGVDGNALCLMSAWKKTATQQGWSEEEIKDVLDQCTASDYNNFISVLSKNCEDDYEG